MQGRTERPAQCGIMDPQGKRSSKRSITRSTRFHNERKSTFLAKYIWLPPILPEDGRKFGFAGCPVASAQLMRPGQDRNSPSALVEEPPTLQPHQTSQLSKLTRLRKPSAAGLPSERREAAHDLARRHASSRLLQCFGSSAECAR